MSTERKTIEQQRLDFLNETVQFYSEDTSRRSVTTDGVCKYRYNGKRCAIGRHIPDEQYSSYLEGKSASNGHVEICLPEKIRNLGTDFLNSVQSLHDWSTYWDEKGLTDSGRAHVDYIKRNYC